MNEFLNLILAGATPIEMFSYVGFAYLGLLLNLGVDTYKRKPDSLNSPVKFSCAYWWVDNKRRIILSCILIPIVVLLANTCNGMLNMGVMNIATAFFIGWSGDGISVLLKNKGVIRGCKV